MSNDPQYTKGFKDAIAAAIKAAEPVSRAASERIATLPIPQKALLTTAETCRVLGVSRTTLQKWERKGTIQKSPLSSSRRGRYPASKIWELIT